jgi:NTP pyrophosphatase (non-canonical NTP hydrolase)
MSNLLSDLLSEILEFREARDWAQFHTPRNLAAALSIEAAELQETMLWKTDAQVRSLLDDPDRSRAVQHELADILVYALLLCHSAGVDPASAIREKLTINAAKYPVDLARGNATKYTHLQQSADEAS